MLNITPGLQPDMTGDAYHAAPGISKSKLDDIAEKAPVHYWHKYLRPNREPEERTEALILGDAIHAAIGEPDTVSSRFIVVPEDAPRRPTKSQLNAKNPSLESRGSIDYWKAFMEEHQAKTILTPAQMKVVMGCRDAAWSDPLIRGLLEGAEAEQTYYAIDPETGALIKCRPDAQRLDRGLLLDIKSTEDASEEAFFRSGRKYRYDVQDPFYTDTVNLALGYNVVDTFAFIVIEKAEPHATAVRYYPREDALAGREKARDNLRAIAAYTERYGAERWPSYTEHGPQAIQSRWRRQQNER